MASVRVFVSYRRDDSRHVAGRIADHVGWEREVRDVFFDTKSIAPGANFPTRIEKAVDRATHTLVVIGPRWVGANLPGLAKPRVFDENDLVLQEVARALRGDGEVIPVFVDGASLPKPSELPESLQPLCSRNGYSIHNEQSLADELRPLLRHIIGHEPRGGDTPISVVGKAAVGACVGFVAFLLFSALVKFGFGLTAADLFRIPDVERSTALWNLLIWLFVILGAIAVPVLWRRWRLPALGASQAMRRGA